MTSTPTTLLPLRSAATWTAKSCDVCGESTRLHALTRRRYELSTRKHRAEMLLDDVICERCGFLFAGKVPDMEFISDFYRDAHTPNSELRDIKPDFDAAARMSTLSAHLPAGCTVLEIGANDGAFTKALRENGFQAMGLDPLETAKDEFVVNAFAADGAEASSNGSLQKKYDAVLAYFVLEHVTDARAWLNEARDYLSASGTLVIEVPNFDTHPVESLYPEHFLHLTPVHLSRLLEECGFTVIECGKAKPSRYFGFTCVARRVDPSVPSRALSEADSEASVTRTQLRRREALDLISEEESRMAALAAHVIHKCAVMTAKPAIYIWAANIHATRLARAMHELKPELKLTAVDSAVSRIGTLHEGFESPVIRPEFDPTQPGGHLFLLCSPNWNSDIRQQIGSFALPDTEVIDAILWKP